MKRKWRKFFIPVFILGLILTISFVKFDTKAADLILVLNPGHGDHDPGATKTYDGVLIKEKDLNLKISEYARQELLKYNNVQVYMTRTDDTFLSLTARADYGKSKGADAFISIHNNAASATSANGSEVGVASGNDGNPFYKNQTRLMAKNILEGFVSLGLNLRGNGGYLIRFSPTTKYPNGMPADYYAVVQYPIRRGFPGILVECAFVTNESDYRNFLSTDAKLQALGVKIAEGLAKTYNLSKTTQSPTPTPIPTANPDPFNGIIDTTLEYIPLSLQGEGGYDPRTVSSNGDIAQRFVVPAGKALEEIKFPSLPTWSVPSNVDLILYSWNTDYATSVAGTVLATYHVESHTDNAPLAFKMNRPFPAGQYLVVMKQMPGYTCGVWVYSSNGDTTLFSGGNAVPNESAFVEIGLANILDNVTIYSTYPHNHYNENHGNVNLTYTYDSNAEYQGPGVVNASLGAIGQKITVPRGEVLTYYAIHPIAAGGNFDYDVYKWNTNYATTIAGPILASRQLLSIPTGGGSELYFNNVYLPEGEYLILQRKTMEGYNIGPTSGGLSDNAVTFYNGSQVDWSIKSFYFTKYTKPNNLPVESTYKLDFSKASDVAKVTNYSGANVSQENSVLKIEFTLEGDTGVNVNMNDAKPWEVDVSVYKYAAFVVKRNAGSSLGSQLYYNNSAIGGAVGSLVSIGSYLNTTRWQNVIYDLSNLTLPVEGIANYFRYDALGHSYIGDVIEVESIRFFKTREAAEASFVQPIVGLYGDVNGDNLINVVDITLVSKHIAGNHIFDEDKEILADVNGDGDRDILDITLIAKYIAEQISEFPAEEI